MLVYPHLTYILNFFIFMRREIEIRHFCFLHLKIKIILISPKLKQFDLYQLTNSSNELSFHFNLLVIIYHLDLYLFMRFLSALSSWFTQDLNFNQINYRNQGKNGINHFSVNLTNLYLFDQTLCIQCMHYFKIDLPKYYSHNVFCCCLNAPLSLLRNPS